MDLLDFVRESNRIEGIHRPPSPAEMKAHYQFLALENPTVADLETFVSIVAGKELRQHHGMNVRVGRHIAPAGGPEMAGTLGFLLDTIKRGMDPYTAHLRYESLHPFMDGNGRSGRALWLWQMLRAPGDKWAWMVRDGALRIGFLHAFYYQALDGTNKETAHD